MTDNIIERLHKMSPKHLHNLIEAIYYADGINAPHIAYASIFEVRNTTKLAEYIKGFDPFKVERAHNKLLEQYRSKAQPYSVYKKGRPLGAKNKGAHDAVDALEEMLTDDSSAQTDKYDFDEYIKQQEETEASVPATGTQMLDASKFALKAELRDVAVNLEKALRGYCEGNFNQVFETGNLHQELINTLAKRVDNLVDHRPTIVELKRTDMPSISMGIQHKNFPLLLKAATARNRSGNHLNVWLFGPAGTGKTTAAEKLAEALELKYYYNGSLTTSFQLLGYNGANGQYVTTAFRQAWEFGGVYLFDEIDGSMPDALLSMNGALANSIASFPDGMIPRHPDCIILAGANTTGLGGGIEYVGAMKQNAAFLNRFVYIPWPHDNALEDALCANKAWLERVRFVRSRFIAQGNKGHLITMRATLFGETLLAAGLTQEEVEHATLKQGLSDAQWNAIK